MIKLIDEDSQTVVVSGEPTYRNIIIGETRGDGFVVAVRDIPEITGDVSKWRVYVDRYLANANVLRARTPDTDDSQPDFIGAADPMAWQIMFDYRGHNYKIGNRENTIDGMPIRRINPADAEVLFSRANTMVDVTLAA